MRRMLGAAYSMMGMHDEARKVYRAWLEVEPDSVLAAFHLQANLGENVPERAPDAYVAQVFDSFASSFDAKLASLEYKAPEFVLRGVEQRIGTPAKLLAVL